jgi:hypothetical protein
VSGLRGEERILGIVKALSGDRYVNAIGGVGLYSDDRFARAGVTLRFLKSGGLSYAQFGSAFVPRLSVIDALMFADSETIGALLADYRLLGQADNCSNVA